MSARSAAAGWMATIAVIAAAASAAATQVRANDLWWHLKTGAWIVEHDAIPRVDPFSLTNAETPWVDHGWLWQVAAWSLHSAGGIGALAALKMVCAVIFAGLAMRVLLRSGFGPHMSSIIVLIAIAGSRFRWTDRPDTASLALLAAFLFLLVAPGIRSAARFIGGALLCALWANVHAGVLLAPILAAAFSIGSLFGGVRTAARRPPDAIDLKSRAFDAAVGLLISAAAILVNPYGAALAAVPFKLGAALDDPRLANPEWLPPPLRIFPLFYLVLAAGLALCATAIIRRGAHALWRTLLLIAAAGSLALTSARHVGVFFTILPFALAAAASRTQSAPSALAGPRVAARAGPAPHWAPILGLAAAITFPLVPSSLGAPPGFGVERGRFPEAEADYIQSNLPAPRFLYNDVAHGGYLIWRFFPEDKIFIDGRNEVHAALLAEIAAALDDGVAWSDLLDRHGIRSALVRYREERIRIVGTQAQGTRSFSALHFPSRRWALVHWGDAGMVFVRREAGHDDLIARDEYRMVQPEDWEHQIRLCDAGEAALREGVLADLRRRLAQSPPSTRARELLDRFETCGPR